MVAHLVALVKSRSGGHNPFDTLAALGV